MEKTSILYQHGTLGLLVPGLFTGTKTIEALLEHGDTGIGTIEGLDGEMIVIDHVAYCAKSDGSVQVVDPEQTVPFASVHFADQNLVKTTYQNLTQAALESQLIAQFPYQNIFFAVTIHGVFKTMKTRVVKKQTPPYPTLVQTADQQAVFEQEGVSGTVVGYYAPAMYQGMTVGGFHVHFLSDQKDFGGHILDFALDHGEITLQPFSNVDLSLPTNDPAFMHEQFADVEQIQKDVNHAEH